MTLTTAPPLHRLAPLHLSVPTGWRSSAELVIRAGVIAWDEVELRLAEVDTVAYGVKPRTRNFIQLGLERRIELASSLAAIEICMGARASSTRREQAQRQAYGAIVETLHSSVEPRIRAEMLRNIASGSTVEIGDLLLTRRGIGPRSEPQQTQAWDSLPTASIDGDNVVVDLAANYPKPLRWTLRPLTPNAVLLPELLAAAAASFS